MGPIVKGLRQIGANDRTVQFVIIVLVLALIIVGLGALAVDIIAALKNQQPVGWASAIVGAEVVFFTVMVSTAHAASQINGSNAQTAQSITNATLPNVQQQNQTVQMAIQALAALHAQQQSATQSTVSAVQDNTQATKENTQATQAADEHMMKG